LQRPYPYNDSVGKGLKILELLAEQGVLSDLQIAETLVYNIITVQQLLLIYQEFGYILRHKDGCYGLSIKILDISRKFRQRCEIKDIAKTYLTQISEKYNETTILGTVEKTDLIYVDKIDGLALLRFVPQIEQKIPAHQTALGKAILAYLPDKELNHYCNLASWQALTQKSILTKEQLLVRLKQIKKQGFAICDEEYCLGLRSLAVVILDALNYPRFSIGICGPATGMTPLKLREMQIDLVEASMEISKYYSASPDKRDANQMNTPVFFDPEKKSHPLKKGIFQRTLAMFL
jgi:DNA-binding IclR family transcriptional regulator